MAQVANDTTASSAAASAIPHVPHEKSTLWALVLGSVGVVYGDIGTSPLYAVKETFNPDHGIPLNAANIVGGLSTIFWILMIVVSLVTPKPSAETLERYN